MEIKTESDILYLLIMNSPRIYPSVQFPKDSPIFVVLRCFDQAPHPSSTFGGSTWTECGLGRESQQLRGRLW